MRYLIQYDRIQIDKFINNTLNSLLKAYDLFYFSTFKLNKAKRGLFRFSRSS